MLISHLHVPYSGNISWPKIFVDFVVICLSTNILSTDYVITHGKAHVQSIPRNFCHEIRHISLSTEILGHENFPLYGTCTLLKLVYRPSLSVCIKKSVRSELIFTQ